MRSRRLVFVAAAILCLATAAIAARSTALRADFLPNLSQNGVGVSDDGNAAYLNGVDGMKVYFGVNNGNANLITYSTGRKLTFALDPASPAAVASGLPTSGPFQAEVDFYGINYYGQFQAMGLNTTAQMKGSLQFKNAGGVTYELLYQSLAVKRIAQNSWLVTTNADELGGFPGFTASDQAELSSFRKRTRLIYGAVNMPMRFTLTLQ